MSLLQRVERNPFGGNDQDDSEESPLLQVASAWAAWEQVKKIPALRIIAENVRLSAEPRYPSGTWGVVGTNGVIYANPFRLAPLDEWVFVLAHLLIHLGMRHGVTDDPSKMLLDERDVNAKLQELEIGSIPHGFVSEPFSLSSWYSAAGMTASDVITVDDLAQPDDKWAMMLTRGLLENLGSKGDFSHWVTAGTSRARQALHWFAEQFPLLSSLAAHFTIIEDRTLIETYQINVAAVNAQRMEIFVNPDIDLSLPELKFIIGHELMHVGLLHHKRREDRNAYLWNIACDYVINAWLIEMGVGEMPPRGGLYDAQYSGMSSNEIYEKLLENPDWVKRLFTFRGEGMGDMLIDLGGKPLMINGKAAEDVAEALMKQGIKRHMDAKRGLLPAGMLEMVAPTYAPPPKWKMSLSRWFEAHFEQLSPARTYARMSRRQQATPDIPRPRFAVPQLPDGSNIFGVVLDTSGSMSNELLSKCLGAIVSLSQKHNIKQVRLIFCDAQPYDEGFVPIKRLMEPIHMRGRGGTRLQPGINALVAAKDFPSDAPILVITDGQCDALTIERDHAFLIPEGARLPFTTIGPVFELK
jgi:predicted metal-dependent peptidase